MVPVDSLGPAPGTVARRVPGTAADDTDAFVAIDIEDVATTVQTSAVLHPLIEDVATTTGARSRLRLMA